MRKGIKKGFTIIELIVVIAVLGVLVLLASGYFIGYAEKAKITQIKSDSKSYETFIGAERQKDENYHTNWNLVDPDDLRDKITEGVLYDKKGLVEDESVISDDMPYYEIPDKLINTHLDGLFIYAEDGKVYYDGPKGNKNNGNGVGYDSTYKDYRWVENEFIGRAKPTISTQLAAIGNYNYNLNEKGVGDNEYGYWHYIGDDEVVIIPEYIQGHKVTSYKRMFANHRDMRDQILPKKIISTNKNITDMSLMFEDALIKVTQYNEDGEPIEDPTFNPADHVLDLTELDTSGVTDMYGMFKNFKGDFVDLSTWNTSNVKSMNSMFKEARNIKLVKKEKLEEFFEMQKLWDENPDAFEMTQEEYDEIYEGILYMNFDTRNVTDMSEMFYGVHDIYPIYIESFNTSNVESMRSMFERAGINDGDSFKHFDTGKVMDMERMFYDATFYDNKLDLSTWETSELESVSDMFNSFKGSYLMDENQNYVSGRLKDVYLNKMTISAEAYTGGMFSGAKIDNVHIDDSVSIDRIKTNRGDKPEAGITFK